jgi:hypothetical protein
MYAGISIQRIKNIKAHAFLELESTPLTIGFESAERGGNYAHGNIVLHLEDAALAAALVEAINSTIAKHAAETQPATDAEAA